MKVRLYKGPFSGKVMESKEAGQNIILIRGDKKMSRIARYEAEYEWHRSGNAIFGTRWQPPLVEAEYRICHGPSGLPTHPVNYSLSHVTSGQSSQIVMMHPDGSLFYEWTGKKREFPR